MRTFLIAYDLSPGSASRQRMAGEIMRLGAVWARPLDCLWYLRADIDAAGLELRLGALLDADDGLVVQEVEAVPALVNAAVRWFGARPAVAKPASADVLAFRAGAAALQPPRTAEAA